MKQLRYLYYKIFKTFKRVDRILNLYYPPKDHADNCLSTILFLTPLWFSVKFKWWHENLYWQFSLAVLFAFVFIGLSWFVENKVAPGSVDMFDKETRLQSIGGALMVNLFLILYIFIGAYTILK